jgi:UDP-N-acetylmuramate: L-alanyl-gamma-D-glutamyl-meso-diaminopimelate ligase
MLPIDMSLNRAPQQLTHIHLMGICGTAMGSLAGMLQEKGFRVTGSDQAVYPPMSTFLAEQGIEIQEGYRPEHLEPSPDLVVVGNVITAANPEAQEMIRKRLPFLSLPQALGHFSLGDKIPLVVTGTHGKTTTAALLASILDRAGLDPSFMIGGILKGYERNYRLGKGPYFVIEGDEYDTAFFDKGPKFLHYRPQMAVLTGIEYDHADIYPDLPSIQQAFARFLRILPPDGLLSVNEADEGARAILKEAPCPVETFGWGGRGLWSLEGLRHTDTGTAFDVYNRGRFWHRFSSPLSGRHNALNFISLLPILRRLGLSPEDMAKGLTAFQGVRRRQEVRGKEKGVTVIDDFAHHPTAVKETLSAVRNRYPGQRLIAVFEPRTNTSRRKVFQKDYVQAFNEADYVIVREAPGLEKIPEGERFSSSRLVDDLSASGKKAAYFPDTEAILDYLLKHLKEGDVVLIMSNGGFDHIHQRLLDALAAEERG